MNDLLSESLESTFYGGSPQWVYLSPHLDDVVLSCGGMIWQQIQNGFRIEIWTIFAGNQPKGELTPFAKSLHARWQSGKNSARVRRLEDAAACRILGAAYHHFDDPDCIYRLDAAGQGVITREEDLFQASYMGESDLVQSVADRMDAELPDDAVLVVPYGFGKHIDHQLVRRSAEILSRHKWFYADYPYSAASTMNILKWLHLAGESYHLAVTENGLEKWQQAVTAYESQLSTFWRSIDDMQMDIANYCRTGVGSLLHHMD